MKGRTSLLAQEAEFLRSIREKPLDEANYLAFADWLEERADPRADLIRVIARSLPACEEQPSAVESLQWKELTAWRSQREQPLNFAWVSECMRQAALQLMLYHLFEKFHSDIRPKNIWVKASDDLSIPAVRLLAPKPRRDPSSFYGTPDYVAPEPATEVFQTVVGDIFSLGCVSYKMLADRLPFGGESPLQKLLARINHDAPQIRSVRRDVPRELDEIVAKMLARLPENRYQTPLEVAESLEPFAMRTPRGR